MACVQKDGKWGFIDKTGKIIALGEYDYVFDFKDGLAPVRRGEKQGYIDKTGRVVVPVEYDLHGWQNYNEGLLAVPKNGKWSILQIITTKDIKVTFGATRYVLNGEPFEQQTMVYDGTAYLPAAYLATKLGLTAKWDAETNTTNLTSTGAKFAAGPGTSPVPAANPVTKTIKATFGATQYFLDGVPFEQQTMVYDGVAYLPAAYLATKLGLTAKWDAETNITTLTSK